MYAYKYVVFQRGNTCFSVPLPGWRRMVSEGFTSADVAVARSVAGVGRMPATEVLLFRMNVYLCAPNK